MHLATLVTPKNALLSQSGVTTSGVAKRGASVVPSHFTNHVRETSKYVQEHVKRNENITTFIDTLEGIKQVIPGAHDFNCFQSYSIFRLIPSYWVSWFQYCKIKMAEAPQEDIPYIPNTDSQSI